MTVLSNTGTVTPVGNSETVVASIAPGSPLDNITVYVQGGQFGGGGPLEFALYTTVGGFQTRVAQMKIMGSAVGTIIDWPSGKGPLSGGSGASGETEDFTAGGSIYTVTVIDLSGGFGSQPRAPVTVTIAGVNTFDTAADGNFGQVFGLTPGQTGTLPTFNGYAQFMDVAIDQTNLPPVTVTVTADCGIIPVPSVQAVVASIQMTGRDNDIAAVFQQLKLPVATRYFVSMTAGNASVSATLTAITYSVAVTASGAIVLNGDVIGPSNNNIDIAWSNVPLLRGAPNGFEPGDLTTDAEIPIFDLALHEWRAFAVTGAITMSNTGVTTLTPGAVITLAGDVTGPSNNNDVVKWSHVPLAQVGPGNFVAPPGPTAVPFYNPGLNEWFAFTPSGDVTYTAAGIGTVVAWEGVPLDPASMGTPAIGSIPVFTANAPNHWVATPAGSIVITLTGNVNGPSNANLWTSLTLDANNVDVVISTPQGWYYVGVRNLAATHQVLLPAAPDDGEVVVVTDEDGSFMGQTFNVVGNGKNIISAEGTLATFPMNTTYPGTHGSTMFQYDAAAGAWFVFADYAPNAATGGVVTLAGNANGPSNANSVEDFGIESVFPANVAAAQFVPISAGEWYVGLSGIPPLGGVITVTLLDSFPPGSKVTVKDEDGSLANGDFVVGTTGKTIDGNLTFTMNLATPGPKGSITFERNFLPINEWAVV